MSTKKKAIQDLIYISNHTNVKDFLERGKVMKKAKELKLTNLEKYVGFNSTKYLDLLVEDWDQHK